MARRAPSAARPRRVIPRLRLVLAALAAVLLVYPWLVEPRRLVVVRRDVAPPHWPAPFDGLKVGVMGDLHTGSPGMTVARLRRAVAALNAERPDLVVLLGDYVIQGVLGGHFVPPEDTAAVLRELRTPLGVVAVLGNHDWRFNGPRVAAAFRAVAIPVLDNANLGLAVRGRRLWLAGVADKWTRRPDIGRALAGIPPADPVLVLMHNPDVFPVIPPRVALTLAAHTHGGQVRLPFLGRPFVPSAYGQRFAAGLIVEGGRMMYVTTGLGTSILPVRFGVPPEVVVLTLRAAP